VFAVRDEGPEASAQAELGLPADVLDRLGEAFDPFLNVLGDLGGEAVGPGSLDEGAAGAGVAGLGDAALVASGAAGVLGGDQPDEGGELARVVEAGDVAELGDDRECNEPLDAAQGLDGVDDRLEAPGRGEFNKLVLEASQALDLLVDGMERFLEDDLLGGCRQTTRAR